MNILILSRYNSTFVLKDLALIGSHNKVKLLNKPGIILFLRTIRDYDLIYLWFASINYFFLVILARLFKKKIVIVAGGYDVANVKYLKYGSFYSPLKSLLVKIMFHTANKIICVSESNKKETIRNSRISTKKIRMIYHGFESKNEFNFSAKKNIIVTIGIINSKSFLRKGIDRFIKTAEVTPEFQFIIIGKFEPFLSQMQLPSNIKLMGYLDMSELSNIMVQAKIYLQLSRHEAFGCSVAEAMQYGCIPIVSNSYALPEVVGNCGIVIEEPDNFSEIAEIIRYTIDNFTYDRGLSCVDWINNSFSLEKREIDLLKLVSEI
jgi:glycosyltransferase involved in cell wall biosynthesis